MKKSTKIQDPCPSSPTHASGANSKNDHIDTSAAPANNVPFLIEKIATAEVQDTDLFLTIFRILRLKGDIQYVAMSPSDASDIKKVKRHLLDAGAKGGENAKFHDAVVEAVFSKPNGSAMIVIRGGWVGNAGKRFALPNRIVTAKGRVPEPEPRYFLAPYYDKGRAWQLVTRDGGAAATNVHVGARGSSEKWKSTVATPALGSSPMMLGIVAAFAAPLLKIMRVSPFTIVFTGPSSGGKTTSTLVAASVVGIGKELDMPTWHMTPAGLEQAVERHSDSLLPIDDIANNSASAKDLVKLILQTGYRVTAGSVKGTLKKAKSNITGRPVADSGICAIILTSYEHSLRTLAEEAGKSIPDGIRPRFVEAPVAGAELGGVFDLMDVEGSPSEKTKLRGEQVKTIAQACAENHGVVFCEWLAAIIENSDEATAWVNDAKATFIKGATFKRDSSLEVRHADRFAFLYGVGSYAIERKFLPWTSRELMSAMLKVHAASRELIRESTVDEHLAAGQRRYWSLLRDRTRIASASKVGDGKKFDGWYQIDGSRVVVYVAGTTWRHAFESPNQLYQVEKYLAAQGVLLHASGGNLPQPRLPNGKGKKGKRSVQLSFTLNGREKAVRPYRTPKPLSTVSP